MARFTLPRDLYFGPGAMEELKNLKGYKKAFIVTGGSSMKKTGFLQKLEDILKAAGPANPAVRRRGAGSLHRAGV